MLVTFKNSSVKFSWEREWKSHGEYLEDPKQEKVRHAWPDVPEPYKPS